MHRFAGPSFVFGTLAFFLCLSATGADEEKVSLDKVPKEVIESVKARFPKSQLLHASKATSKNIVTYEIALKFKEHHIEATLTLEGKITQFEKQITAQELPKVVADAVARKYADATIKKVEEVIKVDEGREKLDFYEVVIETAQGKSLEVSVGPLGKFLNEEKPNKDKKEESKK